MNPDKRKEQAVDTIIGKYEVGDTEVQLTKRVEDDGSVSYATKVWEGGKFRGAPRGYTSFDQALLVFSEGMRERATEFEKNTA